MLTGSTNGAAKILNISQPAVSKILQHAEQSVGFPLFLRSKGKLVPTQEALQLQRELTPFDEQLRRIRRLATVFRAAPSNRCVSRRRPPSLIICCRKPWHAGAVHFRNQVASYPSRIRGKSSKRCCSTKSRLV